MTAELSADAAIEEITLGLPGGFRAEVLTLGAGVRDLVVPIASGDRRVVLGHADLDAYRVNDAFFGVTAGRHANRIAGGRFTLDGATFELTLNEAGRTHLHGGITGFSRRIWQRVAAAPDAVTLRLVSPDGEDGYPGTLTAEVTYRLLAPATLRIEMTATTDAATIVNLAHHSYFNLAGGGDVRDHRLVVDAARYTPVDADLIPTGELAAVDGTRLDFRTPRPVVQPGDTVLDHNFVLDRAGVDAERLARAARLEAPDGSLALEVWTTEPGLQVYDGSYLTAALTGRDGHPHVPHGGICLEPQRFPDGPNHANFPAPVLRPGGIYSQLTEYRFFAA